MKEPGCSQPRVVAVIRWEGKLSVMDLASNVLLSVVFMQILISFIVYFVDIMIFHSYTISYYGNCVHLYIVLL